MRPAMLVMLAACLNAQTPRVENSKLENRALSESLGKAMARIPGAAWAGYEMPAHGRAQHGCDRNRSTTAYLEGDRTFLLLYRLDNGAVTKIQSYSPGCTIDAGGLTLVWFNGVKPEDSVTYLESLPAKGAVSAIAQHEASNAVPALLRARRDSDVAKRRDALFWMAQRAGEQMAAQIKDSAENDPDTSVKRQAVFALSQLPKSEGVPLLIELAKSNRNSEVRRQAVFWLGQSNDDRAFAFIESVLTR